MTLITEKLQNQTLEDVKAEANLPITQVIVAATSIASFFFRAQPFPDTFTFSDERGGKFHAVVRVCHNVC